MQNVLKEMQPVVQKYAAVLSRVLGVDVEIVDHQLNRIAGTGIFADKVNIDMSPEGHVYNTVIKTGEKKIIENPGSHEICLECPKRYRCEEKFEISTPIKLNEKVIGVIGFVCFEEKQKQQILNNLESYLAFLDHISDLISSKAKEEKEKKKNLQIINLLNNIIDKVEQGVIILDNKNNIVKANKVGEEILNLEGPERKAFLKPTGNNILNQKEYVLKLGTYTYRLAGREYRINLDDIHQNKIFIFNDISTLREKMLKVTSTKENLGLEKIIGKSPVIKSLKEKVKKIACSSSTVLITGESGTGKELFARAVHVESSRADKPFVAINCAAIPDTLLESELFGYVKGAFTGADPDGKMGKIELANKGTLFLDEIGEMPLYLQVKLLRVLEEKRVVRLGSNQPVEVDVRIIAATNKNLERAVTEKTFREDLYYRLNVIPLDIPPLRERKEDIRVLTQHFISKYCVLFDKKVFGLVLNSQKHKMVFFKTTIPHLTGFIGIVV